MWFEIRSSKLLLPYFATPFGTQHLNVPINWNNWRFNLCKQHTFTKFHGPQLFCEAWRCSLHLLDTPNQPPNASSQLWSQYSKYSRKSTHSSKAPESTYLKSPSTLMVSWFPLTYNYQQENNILSAISIELQWISSF